MEKVDMGVRDLLALYDALVRWARIHGESMQNTLEMLEYIRRVKSKEPLRQEVTVQRRQSQPAVSTH